MFKHSLLTLLGAPPATRLGLFVLLLVCGCSAKEEQSSAPTNSSPPSTAASSAPRGEEAAELAEAPNEQTATLSGDNAPGTNDSGTSVSGTTAPGVNSKDPALAPAVRKWTEIPAELTRWSPESNEYIRQRPVAAFVLVPTYTKLAKLQSVIPSALPLIHAYTLAGYDCRIWIGAAHDQDPATMGIYEIRELGHQVNAEVAKLNEQFQGMQSYVPLREVFEPTAFEDCSQLENGLEQWLKDYFRDAVNSPPFGALVVIGHGGKPINGPERLLYLTNAEPTPSDPTTSDINTFRIDRFVSAAYKKRGAPFYVLADTCQTFTEVTGSSTFLADHSGSELRLPSRSYADFPVNDDPALGLYLQQVHETLRENTRGLDAKFSSAREYDYATMLYRCQDGDKAEDFLEGSIAWNFGTQLLEGWKQRKLGSKTLDPRIPPVFLEKTGALFSLGKLWDTTRDGIIKWSRGVGIKSDEPTQTPKLIVGPFDKPMIIASFVPGFKYERIYLRQNLAELLTGDNNLSLDFEGTTIRQQDASDGKQNYSQISLSSPFEAHVAEFQQNKPYFRLWCYSKEADPAASLSFLFSPMSSNEYLSRGFFAQTERVVKCDGALHVFTIPLDDLPGSEDAKGQFTIDRIDFSSMPNQSAQSWPNGRALHIVHAEVVDALSEPEMLLPEHVKGFRAESDLRERWWGKVAMTLKPGDAEKVNTDWELGGAEPSSGKIVYTYGGNGRPLAGITGPLHPKAFLSAGVHEIEFRVTNYDNAATPTASVGMVVYSRQGVLAAWNGTLAVASAGVTIPIAGEGNVEEITFTADGTNCCSIDQLQVKSRIPDLPVVVMNDPSLQEHFENLKKAPPDKPVVPEVDDELRIALLHDEWLFGGNQLASGFRAEWEAFSSGLDKDKSAAVRSFDAKALTLAGPCEDEAIVNELLDWKPDIILVHVGLNELRTSRYEAAKKFIPGSKKTEFQANLEVLIEHLATAGGGKERSVILLAPFTPLAVAANEEGISLLHYAQFKVKEKYKAAAATHELEFVPLNIHADFKRLLKDLTNREAEPIPLNPF